MKILKLLFIVSFLTMLSSCAITQKVDSYTFSWDEDICIIEDTAVRAGFLIEFKKTLDRKGLNTHILPPESSIRDCEFVATYTARWSWDVTIYMSYVEIMIYENGRPVGSVLYDSTSGSLRLDKWKDAEPKIRELVDELFIVSS